MDTTHINKDQEYSIATRIKQGMGLSTVKVRKSKELSSQDDGFTIETHMSDELFSIKFDSLDDSSNTTVTSNITKSIFDNLIDDFSHPVDNYIYRIIESSDCNTYSISDLKMRLLLNDGINVIVSRKDLNTLIHDEDFSTSGSPERGDYSLNLAENSFPLYVLSDINTITLINRMPNMEVEIGPETCFSKRTGEKSSAELGGVVSLGVKLPLRFNISINSNVESIILE